MLGRALEPARCGCRMRVTARLGLDERRGPARGADEGEWARALARVQVPADQAQYLTLTGPFYSIADYERAYDTVIEVFDPAKPQLLASFRTDSLFSYAVGHGRVVRLRRTDSGPVIPEIWTVRLYRPLP
jgi:hypothetical protein